MESASLEPGTVIDRYVVERPIGSGGMANVYLVRHAVLGSTHALKVLTLSSPGIRERMRQEGRVQAVLSHPNIVAVTDLVDVNGSPGLIMEYVDGPTLDALIGHGQVPLELVDELARGILAGVAAAHRLGLVHRDLKPANVLLKRVDSGLVPKVTDFGLAKVLSAGDLTGTRTGSTMGTPHYMSPEQVRDSKNVGPQSDIFALGAILYEMCTNRRAFDGADMLVLFLAIANGDYLPPRALRPDLPDRMVDAITRALQVDLANRPNSVDELAAIWSGGTGIPRVSLDNVPGFSAFGSDPGSVHSAGSDPPWAATSDPVAPAKEPAETFADSTDDGLDPPASVPPPSGSPSSGLARSSTSSGPPSVVLVGVAGTALALGIVVVLTVVGALGAYGLATVWRSDPTTAEVGQVTPVPEPPDEIEPEPRQADPPEPAEEPAPASGGPSAVPQVPP
ncbi:MAG: serine/threonine-protein kinase, partial [Myxococcota bacterium]